MSQPARSIPQSDISALEAVWREQRAAFDGNRMPSAAERRKRLATLERMLLDHGEAICAAISTDFGHRPADETRMLELFPSLEASRYARRRVARWMRPDARRVSMWFQPGKAEVRYQPLGVIGIIAPWNYPLYLAVGPLVPALAAGNRAMIKLSEYTPAFAALFADLIARTFPRDLVHVATGGVDVARAFAELPFDHLLFTGSTSVGRDVMSAAARRLTPVTLELGGKSPAVIAPGFDLPTAARRLAFGKLVNAGQTCVAPDYVLAPADSVEPLIQELRKTVRSFYGTVASDDYTSIAHDRHYTRLQSLLEDARARGARIEPLLEPGETRAARRMIPVALLDVNESMRVMQEEIFGPILPVVPYRSPDEAIRYITERDRPLALYVFDDDRARRDDLLARTASGGVTINDTVLHVAQEDLPFGGVGPSGIGRYHGPEGFRTFSLARSVFRQSRLDAVRLLYPPYGRALAKRIQKLMIGE